MKNRLKTRKTVARRFKVSATGKLMHDHTGLNHLMRKKAPQQQRSLLKDAVLDKGNKKRITRMLGHSIKDL